MPPCATPGCGSKEYLVQGNGYCVQCNKAAKEQGIVLGAFVACPHCTPGSGKVKGHKGRHLGSSNSNPKKTKNKPAAAATAAASAASTSGAAAAAAAAAACEPVAPSSRRPHSMPPAVLATLCGRKATR